MSIKAVRVVAFGRVQGVGFRWHIRQAARRASVRGWVRNREDGSVEALIAGESDRVDEVIAAVRAGPPGARVDDVAVDSAADEDVPMPFAVR